MPPPLSSEPYADLYPTINFSLLSPVLEETTPHLTQLLSPPPPSPLFAITPPTIVHPEPFDLTKEEEKELEKEEARFAKIFAKFSFDSQRANPPTSINPTPRLTELSPTTRDTPVFTSDPSPDALVQPKLQARTLPLRPSIENLKKVQEVSAEVQIEDGIIKKRKDCLKWVENCEKARRESQEEEEEEKDLVGCLEQMRLPEADPHPIYSRRRSTSVSQAQGSIPSASTTRASSPTSFAESSRRNSLVIASHYTSPYSSLASTPETSPTSSNFANLKFSLSSPSNSKPSSIRSTSSRFSSFSNKLRSVKLSPSTHGRKRAASESKVNSSPWTTSAPPPPVPPVPDLPSLAQLVPLSAPIPSFLLDESERKKLELSQGQARGEDEGKKPKKKRRDSMISLWKEEQQKRELNVRLEAAYGKIERGSVRKSFDL